MNKFELRIFTYKSGKEQLQYRTKDHWPYSTVPLLDARDYVWSKWKDVPYVNDE